MCLQGGTRRIKSLKRSHPTPQGKCTKSADKVVLRNYSMTRVEFLHWLPLMLYVREVGSHFFKCEATLSTVKLYNYLLLFTLQRIKCIYAACIL